MALFNLNDLKSDLLQKSYNYERESIYESVDTYAKRLLNQSVKTFSAYKTYDVFLSHSMKDAQGVLEIKKKFESYGLSVYVDWIEDRQLDRSKVTQANAHIIRERLKNCKSLIYMLTHHSTQSSWVQWELGLGDGQKNGKVAILPVLTGDEINPNFYKQEYLGLYPYIDYAGSSIFVNGKKYITLKEWLTESQPLQKLLYL